MYKTIYKTDGSFIREPIGDLNEVKNILLEQAKNDTKLYIEKYYPDVKQRSDINDKEFWGAWLIAHFPSFYTSDNLYQKFFMSAAKILEGNSTFDEELRALSEIHTFDTEEYEVKYHTAITQLLKVALRQGWVQSCKLAYNLYRKQVELATNFNAMEKIRLVLPRMGW